MVARRDDPARGPASPAVERAAGRGRRRVRRGVGRGDVAGAAPGRYDRPDVTPQRAASPVLVRLVMLQPGARSVQAAGDFNGWDPASTPLEPTTSGAWT